MSDFTKFPKCVHESWKKCPAFTDEYIRKLAVSLKSNTYYPYNYDVFKAFRKPLHDTKVIILGQSPYHHTYKGVANATGLAFGVDEHRSYEKYPKSLQLICDAVTDSEDDDFDPSLELWEDQGVLLLNCSLTCLHLQSDSHLQLWEPFMTTLFQFFSDEFTPGMIYYFIGRTAQKYRKQIFTLGNTVLHSKHPAFHARNEQAFLDHKFNELANAYKLMYGEPLNYYRNDNN